MGNSVCNVTSYFFDGKCAICISLKQIKSEVQPVENVQTFLNNCTDLNVSIQSNLGY